MPRVLIVEDESHLAHGLHFNLAAEGYDVELIDNGEEALARLLDRRESFDVLLLDVMLPGKDGFTVARELREAQHYIPLLMLTARGRPEDVLQGFESGADDYLPKPFDLAILVARIGSLLRRKQWFRESGAVARGEAGAIGAGGGGSATRADVALSAGGADAAAGAGNTAALNHAGGIGSRGALPNGDQFKFAGMVLDYRKLQLRAGERIVQLTLMETDFLRFLVRNQGRPVSRKEILEQVWNLHENTDTRAIDNFVVRLRRYIETDPAKPRHLLTVRGVGYEFRPEPAR